MSSIEATSLGRNVKDFGRLQNKYLMCSNLALFGIPFNTVSSKNVVLMILEYQDFFNSLKSSHAGEIYFFQQKYYVLSWWDPTSL